MLDAILKTLVTAMLPILEIRGAIPVGVAAGMDPGHTPGGVSLICENALFVGDTLFRGSCGRTDLPGGDTETEMRSIKKLCELPGDYEVYPGHMDGTTLERERRFNYYCREAMANY